MILAGLGCAFMPEYMVMFPGLPTRVLVDPEVKCTVQLVTVAGRHFSPALDAFVRLAARHDWAGA